MKVITLSCNQCGAPLEVSHRAKFVTCNFCTARLEIKRDAGSTWTEELEELRGEVKKLKTREAIRKYDKRWLEDRKRYMNRNKNGEYSVPCKREATAVFLLIFVPVSIALILKSDDAHFLGYIVITLGFLYTFFQYSKAESFQRAKDSYWKGRRRLLEKMRESA